MYIIMHIYKRSIHNISHNVNLFYGTVRILHLMCFKKVENLIYCGDR